MPAHSFYASATRRSFSAEKACHVDLDRVLTQVISSLAASRSYVEAVNVVVTEFPANSVLKLCPRVQFMLRPRVDHFQRRKPTLCTSETPARASHLRDHCRVARQNKMLEAKLMHSKRDLGGVLAVSLHCSVPPGCLRTSPRLPSRHLRPDVTSAASLEKTRAS